MTPRRWLQTLRAYCLDGLRHGRVKTLDEVLLRFFSISLEKGFLIGPHFDLVLQEWISSKPDGFRSADYLQVCPTPKNPDLKL